MKVIEVETIQNQEDFIKLPQRLYGKDYHQDEATVWQFLKGTHPLSNDAQIKHYLLTNAGEILGRMTLTAYSESQTLFLGFFECVDDLKAAKMLFKRAKEEAASMGYFSVTGPVDVSFWVGYRMKVNGFDRVFMGEPQNKPYYVHLFEEAGFEIIQEYVSHYHPRTPQNFEFTKFQKRSQMIRERGIQIIHPDFHDFDKYLKDIHELLMELYKDFPAFVPISLEDFTLMFGNLKRISDPRLIVLAYDGEQVVGFFISFPDYGNGLLTGSVIRKLWHLVTLKWTPKRIILSYTGVKRGYEGLSGALYIEVLQHLKRKNLPGVSTLMQKGKVTAGFSNGKIESTTEYRLYQWVF